MEHEKDVNVLKSLSRVREHLNALFLPDITTADGRFVEQFAVERGEFVKRSKFAFPEEQPTTDDWQTWNTFWNSHLLQNRELPTPLGSWTCVSHRDWEWRYSSLTKFFIERAASITPAM